MRCKITINNCNTRAKRMIFLIINATHNKNRLIPLPFREGPGVGPFVKKYCLSTPL